MAGTYKTAGRERLLDYLRHHPDRPMTAEELSAHLHRENRPSASPSGGKSSVYRHLSEMCRDGTVRKYRDEQKSAYVYQYVGELDCSHHLHLKCLSCGRVCHLECTVSEDLLSHIRSHHAFDIDRGMSILYGICRECQENGENGDNGENA